MAIKFSSLESVVNRLIELNYTISFMEGCSGGAIASAFTNVKGCSNAFNISAVTYSSEAMIKLGVAPRVIEEDGMYSVNTSKEMAKAITRYANSQIGVGVSGNFNIINNTGVKGGDIYISVYKKQTRELSTKVIKIKSPNRQDAKDAIVNIVIDDLIKMLKIN